MAASRKNVPLWCQLIVGAIVLIAFMMSASIRIACLIVAALAGLIQSRRRHSVTRK